MTINYLKEAANIVSSGCCVLQAAHLAVDVLVGVEAEEAAVVRQGDEVQAGHAGPQTVLQCRYVDRDM